MLRQVRLPFSELSADLTGIPETRLHEQDLCAGYSSTLFAMGLEAWDVQGIFHRLLPLR